MITKIRASFILIALVISTSGAFGGEINKDIKIQLGQINKMSPKANNPIEYKFGFHEGDKIPMSFLAQGDFIESLDQQEILLTVKKDFWLKIINDEFFISFDDLNYNPLNSKVKGEGSIGLTLNPATGLTEKIRMQLIAIEKGESNLK